jgi:type IV secretory pathway protease TraF
MPALRQPVMRGALDARYFGAIPASAITLL